MKKVQLPYQYYYLFICLFFCVSLQAQDCTLSKEVKLDYERLFQNIKSEFPNRALLLADSLLLTLEEKGKTQCSAYLWVRYKKGYALGLLDQNEETLTLHYQLIRDAKALGNWEVVANAYISNAKAHEILGRDQDCLRNLKKARQVINKHQLNAVYARFAVRYASYHRIYDNRDSTRIYAMKAIEYGIKYDVEKSLIDGHLLMGIISENMEKSVFHFQVASDLFYNQKSYLAAGSQKGNIATSYLLAKKFQKAALHLDTAFYYTELTSQTYPQYFQQSEYLYNIKAAIAEAQGLPDSAIVYLKKSQNAGKNYIIKRNQENISQKEITFAVEQEQEKLKSERQRINSLIWLVVLMCLLLTVAGVGFVNNRMKGKEIASKNKALKEALEFQSILLSEIHHRVKNNLQLVISLLTIRSYKTDSKDLKSHLNDISNKIGSIALIHEQLYQTEIFEKVNIQNYLSQLFAYFKTIDLVDNSFSFHINTNKIDLNLETIVPLGILCSELISNSLKYGQKPNETLHISIVLDKDENDLLFRYQDNGIGYPDGLLKQKTNSMGTLLIKSMSRQLMGAYETKNENGAVFILTFMEKEVSSV